MSRAERGLALRRQPPDRQLAVPPGLESAAGYAREARSQRTVKRYKDAFAIFVAWCKDQGLRPLPAEPATVAAYLAARADAGRRVLTIELELTRHRGGPQGSGVRLSPDPSPRRRHPEGDPPPAGHWRPGRRRR